MTPYEDRLILIAFSEKRRLLFVVHAEVERNAIRIVSARKASSAQKKSMNWVEEPIDLNVWKRVPGHPFADYDPTDGIALWSLWEMPSSAVGKLIRRGRPPSRPTAVRSVRLPVATWKRLEAEANAESTTVNALLAKRIG